MAGITTSFEAHGVGTFLAKLQVVSDPRKLERATRDSLGRSARVVIVPRLVKKADWKYGGHGGAYPTKGILGKRSAITARKVRTRSGEYVAVSIKYRGWPGRVAAWTVQGTKPHLIRARGAGQSGVDSRARRINRGTESLGDRAALAFGGRFVLVVQHPGAKPTPFIHDAVQGTERLVMDALAADLFRQMDRAASGKK